MAQSATAKSNGKQASPSYDDVTAQLETLRDDIASLTRTVADMGVAKKDQMAAAASERAAQAREKGREAVDQAKATASDAAAATNRKIQENPAAAMGIATGVGFLLGVMFARK